MTGKVGEAGQGDRLWEVVVSSVGSISILLSGWLGDTLSVRSSSWTWLGERGCGGLAVSSLGAGLFASAMPSSSFTLRGNSYKWRKTLMKGHNAPQD